MPFFGPVLDLVQILFHMSRKFQIYNIRETLIHKIRNHDSEIRRFQILAVLFHIFLRSNIGNNRSIGGRSSNAVFLQGTDQGCFRITGWRLCELLFRDHAVQKHFLAFCKLGKRIFRCVLVILSGICGKHGISGKLQFRVTGFEKMPGRNDIRCNIVISRIGHL